MATNVVGMFEHTLEAEDTIAELQQAGFGRDHISIIAQDASGKPATSTGATNVVTAGAEGGAIIGGIAGLLVGLGSIAIPGIGPLIAAGPLAAAIASAGVGAAAGGLIGALTGMNIPESDANYYAEGIRAGRALLVVRTDDAHAEEAREIMDRRGALRIGQSEQEVQQEELSRSSEPDVPQLTRTAARVYVGGLEMDPRKSRIEDFK